MMNEWWMVSVPTFHHGITDYMRVVNDHIYYPKNQHLMCVLSLMMRTYIWHIWKHMYCLIPIRTNMADQEKIPVMNHSFWAELTPKVVESLFPVHQGTQVLEQKQPRTYNSSRCRIHTNWWLHIHVIMLFFVHAKQNTCSPEIHSFHVYSTCKRNYIMLEHNLKFIWVSVKRCYLESY